MKIIDVAAGLVFREDRLLITQRKVGDHLGGLWEFPGGKREPNEDFEACLIRELREELGIEILVHECIEDLIHEYPGKSVHLRFFRCQLQSHSREPNAIGCAALAWITARELNSYQFPEADARLLEKLATKREWWRSNSNSLMRIAPELHS